MSDMKPVIEPKSDQLNADDLIAGEITVTISKVSIRGGPEQPVAVHFEGDNGKPYKPCKSMCRVMVHAWGPDSSKYIGRSMTLYCDPKVKWAGMEVGGIRISHMSHIDDKLTMALTASKGKRQPYTVQPLTVTDYASQIAAAATLDELTAVWKNIPRDDKERYTGAKDKRKAELSAAGQPDDI